MVATIKPPPNLAVVFCYSLAWLSGAAFFFIEKKNNFVRFHALQSIIAFGILTVPIVILNYIGPIGGILYWVLVISYWIIVAFSLLLWIFLTFKAHQGQTYMLPIASNIAKRILYLLKGGTFKYKVVEFSTEERGNITAATKSLSLDNKLGQKLNNLSRTLNQAVEAIATLCEMRDPYTARHQRRVAQLARAIAREMGLAKEQVDLTHVASVIHDIGKVAVPMDILSKPGRLNDDEFNIIKKHPQAAHNILKKFEFPWPVSQTILQHHERLNGSGYPKGLLGEDIILEARILGVADVVEAMASHRPYRPALGINKALEEITQNVNILYDPKVVNTCLRLFTEKEFKLE